MVVAKKSGEEVCYDPRDPNQRLADPATWKPTRNPALVAGKALAAWRSQNPPTEDFWQHITRWADDCDEPVPIPAP